MAQLSWQSWVVIVLHVIWFVILIHEMLNFWSMRKKMKIHARSPVLALMSGAMSIVLQFLVMLQQVMTQEGMTFPCVLYLYVNAPAISLYAVPYLLRGLRVVIISDKVWRAKYSMVLSRQNVMPLIVVLFFALTAICGFLHRKVPQVYGRNPTAKCYILGDWWVWGPLSFMCAGFSSKLFVELARVQDRINMSKEIQMAAFSWLINAVPLFSCIVLNHYKVIDVPVAINYHMTFCTILTDISTFILEPRRHKGEVPLPACLKPCLKKKKKKVAVVMDEPHIAKWREKWHNSIVIMGHPVLDPAFEKHVQDYLCSESYDFLKALDKYIVQAAEVTPEELFDKFRAIVDMYILAGSELEVNIETAMRNKVLKIGDKDPFLAADDEARRDIFAPSGVEIRKMLDENLMKTFLTTPQFLNACQRVEEEEQAAEDENSASVSSMSVKAKDRRNTLLVLGGLDSNVEDGLSMAQASLKMEGGGSKS